MASPDLTNIGPVGPYGPTAFPPEPIIGPPLPPETSVEAPELVAKSIPAGQISVLNPEGLPGTLPIDWFLKEGVKKGYKLPASGSDIPDAVDFTSDNEIKVIRKSDGLPGSVPLDWYLENKNGRNYIPASKADTASLQSHNEKIRDYEKFINNPVQYKIDSDLNVVPRDSSLGILDAAKQGDEERTAGLSRLTDENGNYKMITPSGDNIFVPQDQVMSLLTSGADFKFADPNFQALYDAQIRNIEKKGTGEAASVISGVAKSIPFVSSLQKSDVFEDNSPDELAANLAGTYLKDTKYQKAELYGEIGGTVAQILSPTGIFGEVKAAQAAKAGLVAKLAPEGAGVLRTLGVKSLGSAVEGAIIASPQAISQAIIKENPMAAAESIGVGAGIGLALFGGGQLVRGAGSLLKKGSEAIKDTLIPTSLKGAGVLPQTIEELERLPAGAFPEGGKKYFSDLLKMEKLSRKSGNDDLINTAKKIAEGDDDVVQLLDKLDQSAYQSNKTYPLSSADLVNKIKSANQHLLQSSFQGEKAAQLIEEQAQKLVKMSEKGSLSLTDVHQFAKSIGRKIDWSDVKKMDRAQLETQIYRNIWSTSLNEMKKIGTEVSTASKNAELINLMARESFLMNASQDIIGQSLVGVKPEFNTLVKTFTDLISNKSAAAIGGAVGYGIPGAVVGQAIGSVANTIVGGVEDALAKHWSKNPASKLGKWFMTNKATQGIGNFLAIDAVASMDSTIKQIAPVIQQLSGPVKVGSIKLPLVFTGAENPIKEILGDQVNGLSKAQQIRKLSSSLSEAVSNPTAFNERFQLYIAPLFKDHPELTNQLYLDYQKKIQVLNDIVNAYNIKQPQAFQGKEKLYQPTPSQEQEMQGLLRVALNPYALLQAVQNGRVSTKQVEIVNQLNPAILAKMREAILVEAYSGKVKLPYQQRVALSVLMGAPMDPSLKNGAAMQAIYGQPAQQPTGQPPKKQGNSKPIKPSAVANYTQSQRISGL